MQYKVPYELVIDTDSYSGNFERELCAYVTGLWDGETHGGDQASVFEEEMDGINPFEDYVAYVDDEYNIQSPQCLELTPERFKVETPYSSVGIFFEKKPTPELIQLAKERAYKFAEEGLIFDKRVELKILGFRLLTQTITIEEEDI